MYANLDDVAFYILSGYLPTHSRIGPWEKCKTLTNYVQYAFIILALGSGHGPEWCTESRIVALDSSKSIMVMSVMPGSPVSESILDLCYKWKQVPFRGVFAADPLCYQMIPHPTYKQWLALCTYIDQLYILHYNTISNQCSLFHCMTNWIFSCPLCRVG